MGSMAVDFLSDEQVAGFGGFPDEVSAEAWIVSVGWTIPTCRWLVAAAFDTDDWLFRVLTMVQMRGVVVLAIGLPQM